jgi:aminopeptidase N
MTRLFKYHPEDFGALPVRVIHMDLVFDVYDDHTRVASRLHGETGEDPLSELALDAKMLEIHSVRCEECDITYDYRQGENKLIIRFDTPLPAHSRFVIATDTVCRPTKHILEGLYYDETPPGAPPQQITQCQQWGFQRLVPCIDDMTAKCTYMTTIIADDRYTHLITNGDVIEPRHAIGGGRARIRYANMKTPMAPYLFFLGVGTYASFAQEFEYPDGHTFLLELLVPPGTDPALAESALAMLNNAVMWVHLFTGEEQYAYLPLRHQLRDLMRERDALKAGHADPGVIEEVRMQLHELAQTIRTGYTYTGTVYREIGMQNSDFGGMENVGNTTITTNRIMPFPEMTDPAFEYMVRVKLHEFYHNLNGSEVTGRTPFELWLNEAVTVHVEQQHHSYLFGEAYSRLQTVLTLLAPEGGTFSLDSSSAPIPIEPDGFDDPNDLITGITYVKGAEFVRMIEALMGREQFAEGLSLYHTRYRHGNASRADWVRAMEEVSGLDLSPMADVWLKQTGFPVIDVDTAYDDCRRAITFTLTQTGYGREGRPWTFPFRIALVDASGEDQREITRPVHGEHDTFTIEGVARPAYLSLNRGYSFYGKVRDQATPDQLLMQVRTDTDLVNRFVAFHRLADQEKMRLLASPGAEISDLFIDLYHELITDDELMQRAGGQFLTIFESVEDERHAHRYRAIFHARQQLLRAVAARHNDALVALYHRCDSPVSGDTLQDRIRDIKKRQVKNVCLQTLASLDTPEIHALIRRQFDRAETATDRFAAFSYYLNSSVPDKIPLIEAFLSEAKKNLVTWEGFLSSIGRTTSPDAVNLVRRIEASDAFRIEQANDQRALYGRFAQNRMISLQTEEGRGLLASILQKLAPINEFSTVNILRVFGTIDRMEEEYHVPLVAILVQMLDVVDPDKLPSVYNTVRRLLIGAPAAVKRYEEEYGAISQIR